MEASTPLDRFGEIIIKNLRDSPIEATELLMAGRAKVENDSQLALMQDQLVQLGESQRELIRQLLDYTSTIAIHDFISELQNANDEGLEVIIDDVNVIEESDEVQNQLLDEDGWIERFSRYNTMD